MKVIHVLNFYLPQHIAGTEVYVAALVRALRSYQIDSEILIPHYGEKENAHYSFEDTEVIRYAEPSLPVREIITGKLAPEGLKNFLAVLEERQPDLVHFHELAGSNGIGLLHVAKAKAAGFKTVMTFHLAKYTCRTGTLMYMNREKCDGVIRKIRCSKCWLNDRGETGLRASLISTGFTVMNALHIDTRKMNNSIGTALAFPMIIEEMKKEIINLENNTDAFIVLKEWYRDILIRNKIKPGHISFIDQGLPNYPVFAENKKVTGGQLKLVFAGRISHLKGVDILIHSLKKVDSASISLDIYGTATDDLYLQQCMDDAAGMNNISWKGSIPPENMINTIRNYDVICIPSAFSEMGPLVLKEAFAAGVPAIASEVYGNEEQIIHNENGWLFKFKDADDLRIKLEFLLNDRENIKRVAANIKTVRSFDPVAAEHKILYEKIMAI